jgi:hypothetical protein
VSPRPKPLLLAALAAAAALGACGSEGGGEVTDEALPYSFSYPEGFGEAEEVDLGQATVGFENQTVVATGDGSELIAVLARDQRPPVTPKLLPRAKRRLRRIAAAVGTVENRKDVTVDDVSGVQFDVSIGQTAPPTGVRLTYLPKGGILVLVLCQWQKERAKVLEACGEVLDTLRVK